MAEENNLDLWDDRKLKGIDLSVHEKLKPFRRKLITIKDKHLVLDIKGNQNISTFDTSRTNWHVISNEFFKRKTDFRRLSML